MAVSISKFYRHHTNVVTSPVANQVLATVTLDDEKYLLNTVVKATVTIYQTVPLGPEDNVKLVVAGVDLIPMILLPSTNSQIRVVECALHVKWSLPSAYPTVEIHAISAASMTPYHVSLHVQYSFETVGI